MVLYGFTEKKTVLQKEYGEDRIYCYVLQR